MQSEKNGSALNQFSSKAMADDLITQGGWPVSGHHLQKVVKAAQPLYYFLPNFLYSEGG